MKFLTQCVVCGHTAWAKGTDEPETNSCEVDDFVEERCDHVSNGGDFEIIDSEDEDYD